MFIKFIFSEFMFFIDVFMHVNCCEQWPISRRQNGVLDTQ